MIPFMGNVLQNLIKVLPTFRSSIQFSNRNVSCVCSIVSHYNEEVPEVQSSTFIRSMGWSIIERKPSSTLVYIMVPTFRGGGWGVVLGHGMLISQAQQK